MVDNQPNKSIDLLGLKGVSDSIHVVSKGAIDGIGALLGRICLPAAEELGLYFKDKIHSWRAGNAAAIAAATEEVLGNMQTSEPVHAHPKLVGKIFEMGSWEDDREVQRMWAGLLASACTLEGRDQRNLVFIHLLDQLSASQAKLLNFACDKATKSISVTGLVQCAQLQVSEQEVLDIFETDDIHDADVQLDHLREIGVLQFLGGFHPSNNTANIAPSPLGLHLFVRCQGFRGSTSEYFELGKTNSNSEPNPGT